eukprot:726686-Amphidinium_carterae.1
MSTLSRVHLRIHCRDQRGFSHKRHVPQAHEWFGAAASTQRVNNSSPQQQYNISHPVSARSAVIQGG